MGKGGRPLGGSKLARKEIRDKILGGIRLGMSYAALLRAVGVCQHTYERYCRANPAFQAEVAEAEGEAEEALLAHIRRAAVKTWQAAAWLLERRWPERWSQHTYDHAEGSEIKVVIEQKGA